MTIETAVTIAGIVLVFGAFAAALAWADFATRDIRRS
jgi:hypothetical protein